MHVSLFLNVKIKLKNEIVNILLCNKLAKARIF
ncbi:hypothetical protein M2132_000413 [Dysgonomonas sp. PH5-45]|nr:hypothetical protein [Dysgonomonas sp. PH5-45]MDH6387058.1 hypothetical protein [Dysgonomonas sp. PH5-37]